MSAGHPLECDNIAFRGDNAHHAVNNNSSGIYGCGKCGINNYYTQGFMDMQTICLLCIETLKEFLISPLIVG